MADEIIEEAKDQDTDILASDIDAALARTNSTPNSYEALGSAIFTRCELHFADLEDMPPDLPRIYAAAMAEFVDSGIQKFAAGQREHGGDIRDRDIIKEMEKEIMDLAFGYVLALRIQPAFLKIHI